MRYLSLKRLGLTAVLCLIASGAGYAQIQWTVNGVKAGNSNASLANISAVPDGQGGVFMAYENDIDLYGQWLDGSGTPRWGSGGKAVNIEGLAQKNPSVAADGTGGVFIAWADEGSGRIKIQRLNAAGSPLWASNGIYITETTAEQSGVKMVSDGAGGVIAVWRDKRNSATKGVDIWSQRMDSQGNRMWGTTGKVVTEAVGDQSQQALIAEGIGRIVVVWTDYRNGSTNTDIYVQHLNNTGDRSWHVSGNYDGIPVCASAKQQNNPVITKTDGKICIVWADNRNDQYDIYAHMMEVNSDPTWSTANGTLVCNAANSQTDPRVAPDGSGGVIITWPDQRSAYDIYAQRMTVGGTAAWTANGIPVLASASWKGFPEIVSDDAGGALITWVDNRAGNFDIYAQHINAGGSKLWNSTGLPITTKAEHQYWHLMMPDGSGGAITLWQDSQADVFAQKTNDNLVFTAPAAGAVWAGSQSQNIEWAFHTSQVGFHHFTIRASSASGDGFPIIAAQNVTPAALVRAWTPETINSTTVQLKIQAFTSLDVKLAEFTSSVFTIDSEPPGAFNLTSPSSGSVVNLQPTFQWQASADNLTGLHHYELVIDGQTVKNNLQLTSYTLTALEKLSDGPHSWSVRAVDGAGQVRQSATWNFTAAEDNTPPNPFSLASPPDNGWVGTINPAFAWQAATDDITGIHHYKLFVDNGVNPIADNIPSQNTSINTVTLAAGSHTWYVVAVDSAMNERKSTQTWTIKVDNVIPAAFNLTGPADNSWHNTATPTLTWQASEDAGSGLAEYELIIDGSTTPWVDNISPGVNQLALPAGKSLPEGTHTWHIIAKDALGNSRASSATYTLGIDITPPNAFNITSPSNNAWVKSASPALTWQTATDAVSSIAKYELCIDETLNRDNLTVTSTTPVSPLTEGSHSWQVKALDIVGNTTWSSFWHFTVDTQPPSAFNLISPAQGQTVYTNKPTFSWQPTTDATSGFDHFELYINDQQVAGSLTAQQTQYLLSNALPNGSHTWKVVAWDKAGNSVQSGPRNFTTQISPPQITSAAAAQGTEDVYFTYTATATDAENDVLTYAFENTPAWLSVNGATISGTPTEGITSASFLLKVSDSFFTVSQTVTISITPVDDPPQITSAASAEAVEHQPFSYTVTATDPENDPITYSFSNYPAWMTVSGAVIQGVPPEGVTSVTFTATAAANGKTTNLTVTISVAGVDDPPRITSAGTADAIEDIQFVYTATASDPENDPITFSFSGYPTWLTVSGATIQGAPPEGVTAFSFHITASANGKTDQLTVNVSVQAVDDPPEITSPLQVNATEDVPFTYTATAYDAENDPLTLSFSQYDAWLTVSGAVISGIPPEGAVSASFTVTATANGKTVQQVVHIAITQVDDPPVIISAATADAREDVLFVYTAAATDIENDPISFTFSGYPTGWLAASGAVLQGIPPDGVTSFSFTVTATANGKTDQLTVNVTVEAVNDPPVITSADSVTATEDVLFTYTATAVDEEGDPITIQILHIPGWLQKNGAILSGIPVDGTQDTSFTIIATAGALSDTQHVKIRILHVNDAPVITSPDSVNAVENSTFSYSVTVDDVDGPQITVGFSQYPEWLNPMGRVIRGTVPSNSPNTSFRVIVSDNHPSTPLTDTLLVTVLVEQVNDPPVFSRSFPNPQFHNPDTVRWVLALDDYIEDTDNEYSELTWSYTLIDSQRITVNINPDTHLASITAAGMISNFRIAFTVTDPGQASATDTLIIGIMTTGIDQKIGNAPLTFSLSPNYPNPFNPETAIQYGIPRPCHVRLVIYNVQGQVVEILIDKSQDPGVYEARWNGSELASGIYFYQLITEQWQAIRRMVLIK